MASFFFPPFCNGSDDSFISTVIYMIGLDTTLGRFLANDAGASFGNFSANNTVITVIYPGWFGYNLNHIFFAKT